MPLNCHICDYHAVNVQGYGATTEPCASSWGWCSLQAICSQGFIKSPGVLEHGQRKQRTHRNQQISVSGWIECSVRAYLGSSGPSIEPTNPQWQKMCQPWTKKSGFGVPRYIQSWVSIHAHQHMFAHLQGKPTSCIYWCSFTPWIYDCWGTSPCRLVPSKTPIQNAIPW